MQTVVGTCTHPLRNGVYLQAVSLCEERGRVHLDEGQRDPYPGLHRVALSAGQDPREPADVAKMAVALADVNVAKKRVKAAASPVDHELEVVEEE